MRAIKVIQSVVVDEQVDAHRFAIGVGEFVWLARLPHGTVHCRPVRPVKLSWRLDTVGTRQPEPVIASIKYNFFI